MNLGRFVSMMGDHPVTVVPRPDPVEALARMRDLAGTDPDAYRRAVAALARAVNIGTGGRYVAELDRWVAAALRRPAGSPAADPPSQRCAS